MLGERLREMRKRIGYSQAQTARKLHITQGAISQWENDLTIPSVDQLVAIARLFGTTVDELLGGECSGNDAYNEAPKTPEARMLAAGVDQMPKEERERVLKMVRLMFEHTEYFVGMEGDDASTP